MAGAPWTVCYMAGAQGGHGGHGGHKWAQVGTSGHKWTWHARRRDARLFARRGDAGSEIRLRGWVEPGQERVVDGEAYLAAPVLEGFGLPTE